MSPRPGPRLLVVTAVPAERAAVLAGLDPAGTDPAGRRPAGTDPAGAGPWAVTVAVVGVGPAASAAGTGRLLAPAEAAGCRYDAVLVAGIAGGFSGVVGVGGLALASASVAADLGADTDAGFVGIDELGFGTAIAPTDPALTAAVRAALPAAVVGTIVSVSTVTGTAARADALRARYPEVVAEAMEGHGAAVAAAAAGARFAELRAISNPVGPRDRAAWRIPAALAALTTAFATLRTTMPAIGSAPTRTG